MNQEIAQHFDHSEQMSEFAALWARSQTSVAAYISSAIRDFHDAEDVLQEVAEAAARNFDRYDRERVFAAWVMGIARHRILKHLRGVTTRKHIFNSDTLDLLATAHTQVEQEVEEQGKLLQTCIAKLQNKSRQVLEMRYMRSMKLPKIAERLGMSANAVSISLHRVRKSLAQCVAKQLAARGEYHD